MRSSTLATVALTLAGAGWLGGRRFLKSVAFPILLFLTAVPWPARIEQPLIQNMMITVAQMVTELLLWLSVPVESNGAVLRLSNGTVGIVEACSGIRSLMTLATLAVVYAWFFERRWWRRVVLVLAVLPLAVLTNAARVAVTGVLAHTRGASVAEGFLHGISGTLVFVLAVLLLLALAQLLNLTARGHTA